MKKLLLSALLTGATVCAFADGFPEASLYAPVKGASNFTTVCVIWDFQDITLVNGRPEITITTPSGDEYTARAYTEYVMEDDQGGTLDGANPEGENALSVSYYNVLNAGNEGIAKTFDEKGIYTISIPEGCVAIDGVPNPAVELTYNLGHMDYMEPATFEFSEENDSYILTITWNHQTLSKTRAASFGFSGYLRNLQDDYESELLNGLFSLIEDDTVLRVNLSGSIFDDGDYALVFPANQLQNAAGYINPEQTFSFSVGEAGIEAIVSENGYTVVGLNGVKVLETRDASQVKALPAGIYIVNGKKVAIK